MPALAANAAEDTWRYAVEVSAVAQSSPASLTLSWLADPAGGGDYVIYRKTKDETVWPSVAYASAAGTATSWTDPAPPSAGQAYEYKIVKPRVDSSPYSAYGYIYAGNQLPAVLENRGKLMLIVENLYAGALAIELDRLQKDLIGDGWTVVRRDVSRTDSPSSVKALILAESNLRTVFLFGHVPVFRCGNLDVDGHAARPLPSDAYYGDVIGTGWGNGSATTTFASTAVNITSDRITLPSGNTVVHTESGTFTSTGTLPGASGEPQSRLQAGKAYYLRKVTATVIELYRTKAEAAAGNTANRINLTGQGSGSHILTSGGPEFIPSDIELEVGRVDLWDLGCIQPEGSTQDCLDCDHPSGYSTPAEVDLLRNYLNKNHDFRHKKGAFADANDWRRALVGDRFGLGWCCSVHIASTSAYTPPQRTHEAFAASGYRNFAPFFGSIRDVNIFIANTDNVAPNEERWISMLDANRYLWAYGCGGGDWHAAGGLGLHHPEEPNYLNQVWSSDLRGQDAQAVFTLFLGSWFVEWDRRGPEHYQCYQGNPMRTILATPTYGLTAAWSGRPHHVYHHMGLGETIGYGIRLSQNNNGTRYQNQANNFTRGIHMALMGDPTLRLHPVAPPSKFVGTAHGNNPFYVNLTWTASADSSVQGYHIYRSPNASGPFTRLTTSLVTATTYRDPSPPSGSKIYMVRAVKLETSGSGTYLNPSQGIYTAVGDPYPGAAVQWVDNSIPAGGVPGSNGGDAWTWVSSNPTPLFGAGVAHQSNINPQEHQHYFDGATATFTVNAGDWLMTYVYLDPANMPSEIMLQWRSAMSGIWEHRAYWGQNLLNYGINNTASRRYMGALPAAGQWASLMVPASQVDLEGHVLQGMAFTLYGGRATWDLSGTQLLGITVILTIVEPQLFTTEWTNPMMEGALTIEAQYAINGGAWQAFFTAPGDWTIWEELVIPATTGQQVQVRIQFLDGDFPVTGWAYSNIVPAL